MLRLVELLLFLAPFVVFGVWRAVATEGEPSVRLLVAFGCALAVLAGALIWLSREDALPPGAAYEPARLQDGEIVSGHGAKR